MSQLYTNNAISLLNNNLSATDLIIHVSYGDGALYPQPVNPDDFFLITLEDEHAQNREIVKIGNRIGDQLFIVERGFENTIPRFWPEDTLVDHRVTAYTFTNKDWVPGTVQDPSIHNVIPPADTIIADTFTISFPNKIACKWLITVVDELTYRTSVCEVLGCYRGPLQPPMFTVYAKTGDKLKYAIELNLNGQDLELNVNNLDTTNLTVNWLRINY
jgi:hypothetical protein